LFCISLFKSWKQQQNVTYILPYRTRMLHATWHLAPLADVAPPSEWITEKRRVRPPWSSCTVTISCSATMIFCQATSILLICYFILHMRRNGYVLIVKLHLRDGRTDKHARQRPPRSPPSRRVDVAATRDKRTDGRTERRGVLSVRPSARLLDGVLHYRKNAINCKYFTCDVMSSIDYCAWSWDKILTKNMRKKESDESKDILREFPSNFHLGFHNLLRRTGARDSWSTAQHTVAIASHAWRPKLRHEFTRFLIMTIKCTGESVKSSSVVCVCFSFTRPTVSGDIKDWKAAMWGPGPLAHHYTGWPKNSKPLPLSVNHIKSYIKAWQWDSTFFRQLKVSNKYYDSTT